MHITPLCPLSLFFHYPSGRERDQQPQLSQQQRRQLEHEQLVQAAEKERTLQVQLQRQREFDRMQVLKRQQHIQQQQQQQQQHLLQQQSRHHPGQGQGQGQGQQGEFNNWDYGSSSREQQGMHRQQLEQQQQQQHQLQRQQLQLQQQQQQQQQGRGGSMQLKNLLGVSHPGGHDQWTDPHFHAEELQREERYAQQQQLQQQQQSQNQQDQQAEQWMRENGQGRDKLTPSLRDMIQDDQSDPMYGSRSVPRSIGSGQIQNQGLGLGAVKPLNGVRGMSYAQPPPPLGAQYAQAPPPLGKNRLDAGSPANLLGNIIDWSEAQLSMISDRPDIFNDRVEKLQFRGVVEHCCKLESPAEVRDVFCRYMNCSSSSSQVYNRSVYHSIQHVCVCACICIFIHVYIYVCVHVCASV